MTYWAVARTPSNRELYAATKLTLAGYETLAPRAKLIEDGRSRIAALFPGYVFVKIFDRWHDARWCPGVISLIMAGESPARCPDFEIMKIVEAIHPKTGLVRLLKNPPTPPRTQIAEGSTVRILTGSFRGLNAIYQGSSAKQRELVLLDLLGRKVRAELASSDKLEVLLPTSPCAFSQFAVLADSGNPSQHRQSFQRLLTKLRSRPRSAFVFPADLPGLR
jgi:transcription antitermination factor NusG